MRKALLTLACFSMVLSGCKTNLPDIGLAKSPAIPELPANLSQEAKQLPPVVDTSMAGLSRALADTSIAYNEQAYQTNDLIRLYNCVRENQYKKKEDLENCLK